MVSLVSIDEARNHLRTDSDDEDAWLQTWIPIVSASVLSWLKEDWRAYEPILDSNGDPLVDSNGDTFPASDSNGLIVKAVVKGAVLIELATATKFRSGDGASAVAPSEGYGYILCAGATRHLVGLRKSTVR